MNLLALRKEPEFQIGTTDAGDMISVPYNVLSAHLHVIGRTRSGKSRFIADIIRQLILNGKGLGLIDPHGELYDLTMNWLALNKMAAEFRTIHPIEFSDPHSYLSYNPLHIDHPAEAYAVGGMVANALTRIYGGSDPNATPLIKGVLNAVCVILATRKLPLAAARHFLLQGEKEIREQIVRGFPDPYYKDLGEKFSRMSAKEFRDEVASTERRVRDFIGNPMVMRIFSRTEGTLNIREMMDKRHIVLLNTAKKNNFVDFNELRALAMLFTNNTFQTAFSRIPAEKPAPFHLIIDEMQNVVSDDIENILSQSAKYGLYLTLSHQTLAHLVMAGEHIYNGVMSGTLLKAVFQIPMTEAPVFADELFAHEVDFERVKERVKTPAVTGHTTVYMPSISIGASYGSTTTTTTGIANTANSTTGTARTDTDVRGSASATSKGRAHTDVVSGGSGAAQGFSSGSGSSALYALSDAGLFDAGQTHFTESSNSGESNISSSFEGWAEADTESESVTDITSYARAIGDQTSTSKSTGTQASVATAIAQSIVNSVTAGMSGTLKPTIEWIATQTYTLEEQRYELARRIAKQPKRHAYFAVNGEGTIGFTTREVKDPLMIPKIEQKLKDRLIEKSAWIALADMRTEPFEITTPEPQTEKEPVSYFEEE